MEWNRDELLFPEAVAEHHHRKAQIAFLEPHLFEQRPGVSLQVFFAQWPAAIDAPDVLKSLGPDSFAQFLRLRIQLEQCAAELRFRRSFSLDRDLRSRRCPRDC